MLAQHVYNKSSKCTMCIADKTGFKKQITLLTSGISVLCNASLVTLATHLQINIYRTDKFHRKDNFLHEKRQQKQFTRTQIFLV